MHAQRPERHEVARQLAWASAWGVLSALLGLVRFEIPGVTGGFADLREIGVLFAAFHLRHWGYLLVVAAATSLSTPADGSIWSTFAMHAVGGAAAWWAHAWLVRRELSGVVLAAAWSSIVVVYYAGCVVPVMAVTNAMAGLITFAQAPGLYVDVMRSLPYEVIATAAVTSSYLTTTVELARRRRAEASLRLSEARLRRILATAPVGLARATPTHLVWANEQLAAIAARSLDELRAIELARLFDDPSLLTGDAAAVGVETTLRRGDGAQVQVLVHAARVAAEDVDVDDGITLSVLDVSQRARLEAQLRRAEKLEALGQLAGGVAHDFNNLLTVVSLHVSRMRRLDPGLEAQLEPVTTAVDRGAALIAQLLAFSRREPAAPRELALQQLIPQTLELVAPLLGRATVVDVELAPDAPAIVADPTEVEQVLLNLLVNARDALDDGGAGERKIAVRLGAERVNGLPQAALAVSDTGAGMDAATVERIFEPFFTTKADGKGTGLGLATVQRIVEQHHGRIVVDSAPGQGTTFRVLWPAAPPRAA